ncbi:isochorismatase family protein [Parashewanella curva]|uniref:Isochorismatase family protein n=1 Tax=Parashewanella curva TaxID=2338552 RepID=A0A3L8PUC4_9GAMM|nr:isochorismatase family protein [Parashewanella curva]RLV58419.1 isochorismatase family protein [Parashewanella curva]
MNQATPFITTDDTGLLIIDVQGRLAHLMNDTHHLHQQLSTLIQGAKLLELPIIWVEQLPEKLGETSPDIKQLLAPDLSPIEKHTFSGWHNDELQKAIKAANCKNWLLAGIESHICVYQTCKAMQLDDYQTHVVSDAVSSRTKENKEYGIQMMLRQGALRTNVESALFELQQCANNERFKSLVKLIK